MNIIVDIGHPAHVHFFKNFIWQMRSRGHEITITARKKEITLDLLEAFRFTYIFTSHQYRRTLFGYELARRDIQMLWLAKRIHPDLIVGIHSTIAAHISKLTRAKSIIFTDTEPESAKLASMVTFPFSDVICTPSCFSKDLGKKHIRYNGYHELAYLHPTYFTPDPSVLHELGLGENERFTVVRFVSWGASHDVGRHGFSLDEKRKLVHELEKHARVFITSESTLSQEFDKYRITTRPEKIHDLLYYAWLFVGDSQTMTTEAGLLGTPAVRCNSFVGPRDMANFIELEQKYGLIYSFRKPDEAIERAVEILRTPEIKQEWAKRRENLLSDKIDVTQFMIDFIENYPESYYKYKGLSTIKT